MIVYDKTVHVILSESVQAHETLTPASKKFRMATAQCKTEASKLLSTNQQGDVTAGLHFAEPLRLTGTGRKTETFPDSSCLATTTSFLLFSKRQISHFRQS